MFPFDDVIMSGVCTASHGGLNKMADISQTAFQSYFPWVKMFMFPFIFHWRVVPRVWLTTMSLHWLRLWFGPEQCHRHPNLHQPTSLFVSLSFSLSFSHSTPWRSLSLSFCPSPGRKSTALDWVQPQGNYHCYKNQFPLLWNWPLLLESNLPE